MKKKKTNLSAEENTLNGVNSSEKKGAKEILQLRRTSENHQISDSESDNENLEIAGDNSLNNCERLGEETVADNSIIQKEKKKKKGIQTTIENFVSVNSIFNFEDLTSDDEIYTVQCPENCQKNDFYMKSLDFSKNKQHDSNEALESELINSEKKFITLALPRKSSSGVLVKLPIKGHIVIQRVLNAPVPENSYKDQESDNKIRFPDNIKVRHPLLGVEWESHMELANEAIKQENLIRKMKKKLKKEKNLEIKSERKRQSSLECSTPKKKRKHE